MYLIQRFKFLVAFCISFVKAVYVNDDHVQTPLDPQTDNSFLKLVWPDGTEHYVRHWECPDGIWSEDYLLQTPPKCACVKGAVIATRHLCDEAFEILTGDNHCFDISKNMIRKFTFLTGQNGLKGRASTVFRKDAPYVARMISPTPTPTVNEPMDYLFRLNDPYDFSVYATLPQNKAARLTCFKAQVNDSSGPAIQIAKLPTCSNHFRGAQEWCGGLVPYGDYTTTIRVGSKWGPNTSGSGTQGSCPGVGRGMRTKRSPSPSNDQNGNSNNSSNYCDNFPPDKIEATHQSEMNHVESLVDRTEYPHRDFHTASLHQTEVNDQTLLVAKHLVDLHLGDRNNVSLESIRIKYLNDIPAFRYIQLSRVILQRVCPQEDIPPFVLALLVRVFRIIHLNIVQKHPYPEPLEPTGVTNTKILEALTKCRDQRKANITSFIANSTCPAAGYIGSNLTEGQEYYYGKNLTEVPENIRFDPSSMDMALETVWKMMLFVHYYCASDFEVPLYHSEFIVKYEAFFNNPALLYRWYHPGPSNSVLQLLLSAFNLRKFSGALDRCVATAKATSVYTKWLKRPADALTWKPKAVQDKLKTAVTANATKLKRSKRYYFQNNIWYEKAYCLRNSKQVLTEVQSSSIIGCRNKPVWFHNLD